MSKMSKKWKNGKIEKNVKNDKNAKMSKNVKNVKNDKICQNFEKKIKSKYIDFTVHMAIFFQHYLKL